MNKEVVTRLKNIITDFTDDVTFFFNTPLDKAFIVATYILSQDTLPSFSDLSSSDNETIKEYYTDLKSITYTIEEMRRAYSEAYLLSLREKENYTVNVTLELPLLYLRMIADVCALNNDYKNLHVLNAYGNNGNLALALATSENIKPEELTVTVTNLEEVRVASSLRDLCKLDYPIDTALPAFSYRADLIISDPFLRKVEDILIFFEDYTEYLNQGAFFITILPTEYVRSRFFSDSLEKYKLILIGLIEYPKDLLEGLISSSIVIMEKKDEANKEFFHCQMPSIKDIDNNIKVMNDVKTYLQEYFRSNK